MPHPHRRTRQASASIVEDDDDDDRRSIRPSSPSSSSRRPSSSKYPRPSNGQRLDRLPRFWSTTQSATAPFVSTAPTSWSSSGAETGSTYAGLESVSSGTLRRVSITVLDLSDLFERCKTAPGPQSHLGPPPTAFIRGRKGGGRRYGLGKHLHLESTAAPHSGVDGRIAVHSRLTVTTVSRELRAVPPAPVTVVTAGHVRVPDVSTTWAESDGIVRTE